MVWLSDITGGGGACPVGEDWGMVKADANALLVAGVKAYCPEHLDAVTEQLHASGECLPRLSGIARGCGSNVTHDLPWTEVLRDQVRLVDEAVFEIEASRCLRLQDPMRFPVLPFPQLRLSYECRAAAMADRFRFAHAARVSNGSRISSIKGVVAYSTRGGASGWTVRVISPFRSRLRRLRVSMRRLMPSMARSSSVNRCGPLPSTTST